MRDEEKIHQRVTELFYSGSDELTKTCERAVRDALLMHKRLRNPVVVGRDGAIITLEPDAIIIFEDEELDNKMMEDAAQEEQEEFFIYFVSCIDDLNSAWSILKRIKKRPTNSLRGSSFQFALIEYAKPYLNSEGVLRKYRLTQEFVPEEYRELHDRIIKARNKILAHSDLTIRDATLYVSAHSSGKFAGVVQSVVDGTQEFKNIDQIIELIEKTLVKMYEKKKGLESALRPNFID